MESAITLFAGLQAISQFLGIGILDSADCDKIHMLHANTNSDHMPQHIRLS